MAGLGVGDGGGGGSSGGSGGGSGGGVLGTTSVTLTVQMARGQNPQATLASVKQSQTFSGPQYIDLDAVVPARRVDFEVDCYIKVKAIEAFVLWSTEQVIVKTNSSGSPNDTFTLYAGEPLVLSAHTPYTLFVSAVDVTKLFVTNESDNDAEIRLLCLQGAIDSPNDPAAGAATFKGIAGSILTGPLIQPGAGSLTLTPNTPTRTP